MIKLFKFRFNMSKWTFHLRCLRIDLYNILLLFEWKTISEWIIDFFQEHSGSLMCIPGHRQPSLHSKCDPSSPPRSVWFCGLRRLQAGPIWGSSCLSSPDSLLDSAQDSAYLETKGQSGQMSEMSARSGQMSEMSARSGQMSEKRGRVKCPKPEFSQVKFLK